MAARAPFFGTPDQIAFLERGRQVYEVVRHDPRYTYYGRSVGVLSAADANAALMRALIGLQGSASIGHVSGSDMAGVQAAYEAEGLSVTNYARWVGDVSARRAAQEIVGTTPLPAGLSLRAFSPASPHQDWEALADLTSACGVMLPNTQVLSGALRPGVTIMASTAQGQAVSCAAAAAYAHPDHPALGTEAWWGMLSTREDWRGQRLAVLLGAHAILRFLEISPGARFMTGVQDGNAASEAVCARLGFAPDGGRIATLVDAAALPGGKLTR